MARNQRMPCRCAALRARAGGNSPFRIREHHRRATCSERGWCRAETATSSSLSKVSVGICRRKFVPGRMRCVIVFSVHRFNCGYRKGHEIYEMSRSSSNESSRCRRSSPLGLRSVNLGAIHNSPGGFVSYSHLSQFSELIQPRLCEQIAVR